MSGEERWSATWAPTLLAIHLPIAICTAAIWVGLIVVSLRRFPNPPRPTGFARAHLRWGRAGMVGMLATAATGLALYVAAFVL